MIPGTGTDTDTGGTGSPRSADPPRPPTHPACPARPARPARPHDPDTGTGTDGTTGDGTGPRTGAPEAPAPTAPARADPGAAGRGGRGPPAAAAGVRRAARRPGGVGQPWTGRLLAGVGERVDAPAPGPPSSSPVLRAGGDRAAARRGAVRDRGRAVRRAGGRGGRPGGGDRRRVPVVRYRPPAGPPGRRAVRGNGALAGWTTSSHGAASWPYSVMRLVPLFPFNLVNYGAGVSGVRFLPFVTATALGIVPGTLTLVGLGGALRQPGSPDAVGGHRRLGGAERRRRLGCPPLREGGEEGGREDRGAAGALTRSSPVHSALRRPRPHGPTAPRPDGSTARRLHRSTGPRPDGSGEASRRMAAESRAGPGDPEGGDGKARAGRAGGGKVGGGSPGSRRTARSVRTGAGD